MTEYRVARPEEQAALTFFGSMVFSMDGEKTDFETLIPKEYAKERNCAEHHLLAVNEQGIRGMIATLPGVMRVGKLELKTGYVGTVSVHPQARGEGHMKKLMELSLTRMRENGTDISMLGGRRQRYAYFGYESGGLEYHADFRPYTVRQAMAEVDAEGFSFTPVQPGSEEEALALKLQESQPCWVDREPFGFAAAAASYTCGAWAARKDGQFAGYLVANGGKNLGLRAGGTGGLRAGRTGEGLVPAKRAGTSHCNHSRLEPSAAGLPEPICRGHESDPLREDSHSALPFRDRSAADPQGTLYAAGGRRTGAGS